MFRKILVSRMLRNCQMLVHKKIMNIFESHGRIDQNASPHCQGPKFAPRSLTLGFVLNESESGQLFLGDSPISPDINFISPIFEFLSHQFHSFHFTRPMLVRFCSIGTLVQHDIELSSITARFRPFDLFRLQEQAGS